jgi:hypothetical protein
MKSVNALKHAAVPALAAGVLVAALAAPAAAQTSGSTVVRSGSTVSLNARLGAANNVTVDVLTVNGTAFLRFQDTSGITAGWGCTQVNPTTATCGAPNATRMNFALRDGADTLNVSLAIPATTGSTVDAGSGTDIINTGAGSDTISVNDGLGGDQVNCDGGFDSAYGNVGDTINANCEQRYPF